MYIFFYNSIYFTLHLNSNRVVGYNWNKSVNNCFLFQNLYSYYDYYYCKFIYQTVFFFFNYKIVLSRYTIVKIYFIMK